VAKGSFLCKRAQPDSQTAISALCTHNNDPTQDDWCKLLHCMRCLRSTHDDELVLSADDLCVIKWQVHVGFAIRQGFKSHTSGKLTFGKGFPINQSHQQQLNAQSSTASIANWWH